MTVSNLRRFGTAVAGGTAIVAPAAFLATPANAEALSCGDVTGAVEVFDGVCEYVFDEAGTYTFTAPEGVTKISAILIGGGGGGAAYILWGPAVVYGGGGGEVIYVDDISGETEIIVGAGGSSNNETEMSPQDGSETKVGATFARPGRAPALSSENDTGGLSGNENLGAFVVQFGSALGGGGGAGGATETLQGGPGLAASQLPSVDVELFPAIDGELKFGQGGSILDQYGNLLVLPEDVRGESVLDVSSLQTTGVVPAAIPGAGGDGVVDLEESTVTANSGQDGAVVIRWALSAAVESNDESDGALPETGANIGPWALVGAMAAVGAGAATLLSRRVRD